MPKTTFIVLIRLSLSMAFCAAVLSAAAQAKPSGRGMQYRKGDVSHYGVEIDPSGDSVPVVYVNRVYCFPRPIDMREQWKLVRDFRKVYPLALLAHEKMASFEEEMMSLPTKKQRKEFARRIEKEMIAEYTPVLERMTVSQGRILIRLIDRETEYTSYEIVKEFRGGFVAGFWQGVARIFGHNLKDEYDKEERDRMIEQCIRLYNAGLLPEY